jgi:hypothetical protein
VIDQLPKIEPRVIARNVACFFQPLHSRKTGPRRKPHSLREIHVGQPTVLLQLPENVNVDTVELRQSQRASSPSQK